MQTFKEYLAYNEEKGYLSSDFTFGFELEGWMENDDKLDQLAEIADNELGRGSDWTDDESISPNEIPCPKCHGHGSKGCRECGGDGYVHDEDPPTFEMNSPVFKCTPANYLKVIKFLRKAKEIGLRVNASCAFHTHFGLPDIYSRSEDIFWLILKIAIEGHDTLEKLSKFEDIQFANSAYASTEIFKTVASAIKTYVYTGDVYALKQCYSDKKMLLLRQHPQGTLEWRGPRNFIQQEGDKYISGFFKHISSILMDFSNFLNSNTLTVETKKKTVTITKQQIFEILSTAKSPAPHKEKKMDYRFHQSQNPSVISDYMKKYPFLAKGKFYNAVLSDEDEEIRRAVWEDGLFTKLNASGCSFKGGQISDCKLDVCYIDADEVQVGNNVILDNCSVLFKDEITYNVYDDLKEFMDNEEKDV